MIGLRALLALAMPMVLARATQSVMTFADALFVEHLGPGSIAASATGGFNVFLFMILPIGTVFIVQSFVAQLVGAGQREDTPRFAWYGMAIAAIAGIVGLAFIPLIGPALSITDYSPAVQAEMESYMAIRMYSVTAVVATEAIGNWYGGLNNTWMAMVVRRAHDGRRPVPQLGPHLRPPRRARDGRRRRGAIDDDRELGRLRVPRVAFWRRWGGAPPRTKKLGSRSASSGASCGSACRTGSTGSSSSPRSRCSSTSCSRASVTSRSRRCKVVMAINSVSFMPAFGLASAGAILAGQAIGAGDRDAVWPQVKATLLCTMSWMGLIGLLYFVAPEALLGLFDSKGTSPALVVDRNHDARDQRGVAAVRCRLG